MLLKGRICISKSKNFTLGQVRKNLEKAESKNNKSNTIKEVLREDMYYKEQKFHFRASKEKLRKSGK